MEFTELGDYPVPPGILTRWHPCADGEWRDDPRPASYIHEAHLRRFHAGRSRPSWLGAAFEVHDEWDATAFAAAVAEWVARHEVLRSHTALDIAGTRRRTLAPGAVQAAARVHECADSETNSIVLQRIFDVTASPHTWPSYALATIEHRMVDETGWNETGLDATRDPGGFTVLFAADHSLIDGYSVVLVAHELSSLYRQARGGGPAGLPATGSYVDFGARERETEVDPACAAVELWRRELTDGLAEFPLPIGARTDAPQRSLSEWVLDEDSADRFAAAARDAGAGFFAGVLACAGLAGRRVADEREFRTVVPVHTRDDPAWLSSLGWFVGLAPVRFEVGDGGFAAVAQRASRAVRDVRPAGAVPFERVEELLDTPIRPRFVMSYLDLRSTPRSREWPRWNARALRSRQFTHDVYAWVNRTPRGVNLAVRYPANALAGPAVEQWVAALRESLARAAEGYPSVELRGVG